MKVILLDNIRGIGRAGDVKNVNDGYAKNYLIPRKLARASSVAAEREFSQLSAATKQAELLHEHEQKGVIASLQNAHLVLRAKANAQGTLFAGIERSHIAELLSKSAGTRISEKAIALDEHLKTLGEHVVTITIGQHSVSIPISIEPIA